MTMKKMLVALAAVALLGASAVAQSNKQSDPQPIAPSMQSGMSNSQPDSQKTLDKATNGTLDTSDTPTPQATGDPNKDHGVDKLDDLYRYSRGRTSSDWLDPNVTLSSPGDVTN